MDTATPVFISISATLRQEGYKYSTSGLYYAPTAETIEDFVTYIKGGFAVVPLFGLFGFFRKWGWVKNKALWNHGFLCTEHLINEVPNFDISHC